ALGFPQDADDLFVGMSLLHRVLLASRIRELTCRLATRSVSGQFHLWKLVCLEQTQHGSMW
ncbi:hypothetical protein KDW65_31595, partial [Burkholderia cenocepacia]|uniref:hypothetical protein n=1 Tax=Burkholderia cenocepacia TaxID=95486 RepID=UPI001B8FF763